MEMTEKLKVKELEIVFEEKTNQIIFYFGDKELFSMDFQGMVDELFYRALELWSKKYAVG